MSSQALELLNAKLTLLENPNSPDFLDDDQLELCLHIDYLLCLVYHPLLSGEDLAEHYLDLNSLKDDIALISSTNQLV